MAHLNELEIRFDFIGNKHDTSDLLYYYNDILLFLYDKNTHRDTTLFQINSYIYSIFNNKVYDESQLLIKLIKKYFDYNVVIAAYM